MMMRRLYWTFVVLLITHFSSYGTPHGIQATDPFSNAILSARAESALARYDTSFAWYRVAKRQMKSRADTCIFYTDMGHLHRKIQRYDSATFYFHQALDAASDSLSKISILNGLGLSYLNVGAQEEAFQYFQQALLFTVPHQDQYRSSLLSNMLQTLPDTNGRSSIKNRDTDSLASAKAGQLAQMTQISAAWQKQKQSRAAADQDDLYTTMQLKQQQTVIIGSVVSSSLLIIVLYLLFLRKRSQYSDRLNSLQQRLLRIQMNPHFLFNALSCIQHYLLKNDATSASMYLSKFSKLMRQTLELSTRETISIEEEKEMLEHYLTIQQMRSTHKFDFEVIVDPELLLHEAQIPPMCAQPFVENAIEHGQINECKNGKLTIKFEHRDNHLLLLVEDNGLGIHTYHKKKSRRSLSTSITRERLSLLERKFKTKLGLMIGELNEQEERSGTRVQIRLPLI